jgi:hypothetical protein
LRAWWRPDPDLEECATMLAFTARFIRVSDVMAFLSITGDWMCHG